MYLTGPDRAVFTEELRKKLMHQGLVWEISVLSPAVPGIKYELKEALADVNTLGWCVNIC